MNRRTVAGAAALLVLAAAPALPAAPASAGVAEGDAAVLSRVGLDGPPADDSSTGPRLSTDGRLTAFVTSADNLVTADDKAVADVVLRDNIGGSTQLVSRWPG